MPLVTLLGLSAFVIIPEVLMDNLESNSLDLLIHRKPRRKLGACDTPSQSVHFTEAYMSHENTLSHGHKLHLVMRTTRIPASGRRKT